MSMRVRAQQHSESCNTDGDGKEREGEAVAQLVGEEGDDHAEDEGARPWGDGVKLGLGWGVAVGLDDCLERGLGWVSWCGVYIRRR